MKFFLIILSMSYSLTIFSQKNVTVEGNSVNISETAPIWPGCETAENKSDCFNTKFIKHLKNNYRYPRDKNGTFIRGKAVVKMHVAQNGQVIIDSIKTEFSAIKASLKKMLVTLPKMTPGQKARKPVSIRYTIPLHL